MHRNFTITLFGQVTTEDTLIQIAQAVCSGDDDRDAVERLRTHLAFTKGVITAEDISRRGNPFIDLKRSCMIDGVGWRETVCDDNTDEPGVINTWMEGFGSEKTVALGRDGTPVLNLKQLEAGAWGGSDVLVGMVRDLRKHSLLDLEPQLSVADGLFDAVLAEPEARHQPLFQLA